MPKFTIVTCTLNREKFIKQCLESVVSQDFRDFEHIIVDGFSTDKTLEFINEYKRANPQIQIKIIQSPAKGISNAMNIGIQNATGEIIHFLHSDDYYIDNSVLHRLADLFDKHPGSLWVMGNHTRFFMNKLIKVKINKYFEGTKTKHFYKAYNFASHDNTFCRKEFFDKYGLFDERYKFGMDFDYWQRIKPEDSPLITNDNYTVVVMHEGSASFGIGRKHKLLVEAGIIIARNQFFEKK